MVQRFLDNSLLEIVSILEKQLTAMDVGEWLSFEVIDPECSVTHFAGERVECEGVQGVYRSYKVWVELAEQLGCRFLRPLQAEAPFVVIRYQKLALSDSWHTAAKRSGEKEKYGVESGFFRLHKPEEPSFLFEYRESLRQLPMDGPMRILNLGVNKGDEFVLMKALYPDAQWSQWECVGIDHSASALAYAREQLPDENVTFLEADLCDFEALSLGSFDLIVSIGTLHSPALRGRELFRWMLQHWLKPDGHMILGFPNCRYLDHEVRYGAQVKNFQRSELSLLLKEVMFHQKYLRQHRFRTILSGKHTLFLTGIRLPKRG
ncbi:MAG TPA: methyltransferase [Myxococcales bacterium]|nr:methyltransferase [Deltaproteobacteria bacterium]MBU50364.1 methyltransferase [Deltaproteobacteria bacterium]HAA58525.1 methyltransferase [Myxococcales bacterium]|tara:strand:+ start:7717 stop:8673 length:957 start_codon:yes stop_codon:yes gene_type:complete